MKQYPIITEEDVLLDKPKASESHKTIKRLPIREGETTYTYDNRHNHHFPVPVEVYLFEEYREKLNNARTLAEVDHIVHDYYKRYRKT